MIPHTEKKVTVISLPSAPAPAPVPAAAVPSANTLPVASAVPSSYATSANGQAYGGVNVSFLGGQVHSAGRGPPMNPAFHVRS